MTNLDFVHVENFDNGSGYLLPAGEYWIGDPCLVLNDHLWKYFLTMNFDSSEDSYCGKSANGYIAALGTAYGDGTYVDSRFQSHSVDSGLIGMVDTRFIDKDSAPSGMIVKFDKEVRFCKNHENTIYIGDNWFIITDQELLIEV